MIALTGQCLNLAVRIALPCCCTSVWLQSCLELLLGLLSSTHHHLYPNRPGFVLDLGHDDGCIPITLDTTVVSDVRSYEEQLSVYPMSKSRLFLAVDEEHIMSVNYGRRV